MWPRRPVHRSGRARDGEVGSVDYAVHYSTIWGKGVGRARGRRAGLGTAPRGGSTTSGIFDGWPFGFGGLLVPQGACGGCGTRAMSCLARRGGVRVNGRPWTWEGAAPKLLGSPHQPTQRRLDGSIRMMAMAKRGHLRMGQTLPLANNRTIHGVWFSTSGR